MHERAHICRGGDFTLPGAEDHYPPDPALEPVHLELDLRVDVDARSCAGTVTTTVRANVDGARTLTLDAVDFEDLTVRDVGRRALTTRYDGQRLVVTWEEPIARGDERRLAIAYRVVDPDAGLYFSAPSAAYPDAPWFAVTDHETERARHWMPSVDHPSVRPTLDFRLRARADLTILANGALVEETAHDDGTKTARWRLEQRCPSYLTCFAIGDFVRFDDGEHDGKPIAYFASREHTPEQLARTFGRTGDMLAWMTERLGRPFPYPKYFQFAVRGIGGAMENISLVSWDDKFLLDEALESEIRQLIDQINAHEMAHSYFGDLIVCRDFSHAWLKESWATYMETCWLEHDLGRDAQLYDLYQNAEDYFRECDERYKRPIVTRRFNQSWNMYDQHLYPGGACRLHTLRCLLGDDDFWAGVRRYVDRHAMGTVETDDFRRVMEEVSGRSLARFFDQWLRSPGYPHLEVRFEWSTERAEGTFTITQKQAKEEPCFELDLAVEWVIGNETTRRTIPLRERKVVVVVPMSEDPTLVRVDPDAMVLKRLDFDPGEERCRRSLTDRGDLQGRIHAGRVLVRSGKRRNVEAVRDAFRDEAFWGVRVQWARELGAASSQAALDAIVDLLADHDDAPSLGALFDAAASYRDPRVTEVVRARLAAGLPPRAEAAAWRAIGAQREAAPLPEMVEGASRPGHGGFAQAGALAALGSTRRSEALAALAERAAWGGVPLRARPGAALGLGAFARAAERHERERAVEALVDLLRDPDHVMRRSVVDALGAAGAWEATRALTEARKRMPAQDQNRVDKILASLRGRPQEGLQKAEKRLDELTEQLRKVEDRLQRAEAKLEAKSRPE